MEIDGTIINQYINGELSGEELAAFKTKLEADKNFQQKVEVQKDIDEVLMNNHLDLDEDARTKEKKKLQSIFDKIGEKHFAEPNQKKIKRQKRAELVGGSIFELGDDIDTLEQSEDSESQKHIQPPAKIDRSTVTKRLFPVALVTAAAALLLLILNPFATKLSPTQLAGKYFEPFVTSTMMGEPDNDNLKISPKDQLVKASYYYQKNKINKAIEIFKSVANNSSEVYVQKANWYLALCYLKQNQPKKAKPLLKELKQGSDYEEKANAILRQLK